MKRFRTLLKRHRLSVLLITALTAFYGAEGRLWADVVRAERAENERLDQMAERLGVPAERLARQREGLLAGLRNLLSSPQEELREQGLARLEAQAAAIEAKVEANPFGDRAEAVKAEYAPERAEAVLRSLAALTETVEAASPEAGAEGSGVMGNGLTPAARKALLTALRSELDAGLTFEPPGNGRADLPAPARQRSQRLQGQLTAVLAKLRPILNAPDALSEETLERTVGRVAAAVGDEVAVHRRPSRSPDRPLPIQPVERKAKTAAAGDASVAGSSSAFVPGAAGSGPQSTASRSTLASRAAEIAPEITALATELGTPAKIFAHVHDTIRFDPKWGAVRSPLGTLLEGEGTAWDQSWLLQELLTAVGIDARFEWGEIEIPVDLLTNLTGVDDPFRAGDLLATGGVPTLLLVDGGRVVGARISHVWVKAHVDYIPNRGATPTDAAHPADSWIRMDPSLKRTDYAQGLDVHQNVPFEVGGYLESATTLSPRRAYEDALWQYIDTHDIECTTLELLKDQGTVRAEGFPILPGTLRGRILSVTGEAAAVPSANQERVRVEAVSAGGDVLLSHELAWPSVWGQRVEIVYRGATPDDQATIDAYGGVFETPPVSGRPGAGAARSAVRRWRPAPPSARPRTSRSGSPCTTPAASRRCAATRPWPGSTTPWRSTSATCPRRRSTATSRPTPRRWRRATRRPPRRRRSTCWAPSTCGIWAPT